MVDVVVEMVETDSLCGFSHCRAPLPAPGPRGGRPFAYCPDRTWPGGKTCKQLAAAQDALTEALGTPADTGITAATNAFTAAAQQLADPLGEVLATATALRDTLAAELNTAATRVAEAEEKAARERGLRQSAEEATVAAEAEARRAAEQAAEVVRDASVKVERFRAERDEAVAAAETAAEARTRAELAQARAEGIAATEQERAERIVRAERANAEASAKALATVTEKLAATRAERDAARAALTDLRGEMDQRRREMDQLADELATSRSREVELATELGGLRTRIDELTTGMAARANEVTAQLEQAHQTANKLAATEHDLTRLRTTTTALRDVLLTPNLAGDDLRSRLLAELLDPTS
ncbi:hypothetical protein [Actinophytocola sp.]|uniref:hypothetical protein n=1 Tax=Actinophytocola sp. TaxID=1872138 RepID=UPI002ED5E6E7